MFIKKYNQFVKTKVNEDIDLPEDTINGNPELASEEDVEMEVNDMDDSDDMGITGENEYQEIENATEEEEMEEEGGAYIGQKMIQDLADALDVQPDADGSVTYNGKKINFYSETEKFHVDKKKFSSVEEVVNYLQGSTEETSEEDVRRNELEAEDDRAILAGEGEEDFEDEMEPETKFESKSYKFTRKFNNFR